MPPVCSKSFCRSTDSSSLNRLAMPGRNHTGSIAHLTALTTPSAVSSAPSGCSLPALSACAISGILSVVCDTAIVGCTSTPSATAPAPGPAAVPARWPHGSIATILVGSAHDGYGPILMAGSVSERSSGRDGSVSPRATETARWTEYGPLCVPIALRCSG